MSKGILHVSEHAKNSFFELFKNEEFSLKPAESIINNTFDIIHESYATNSVSLEDLRYLAESSIALMNWFIKNSRWALLRKYAEYTYWYTEHLNYVVLPKTHSNEMRTLMDQILIIAMVGLVKNKMALLESGGYYALSAHVRDMCRSTNAYQIEFSMIKPIIKEFSPGEKARMAEIWLLLASYKRLDTLDEWDKVAERVVRDIVSQGLQSELIYMDELKFQCSAVFDYNKVVQKLRNGTQ